MRNRFDAGTNRLQRVLCGGEILCEQEFVQPYEIVVRVRCETDAVFLHAWSFARAAATRRESLRSIASAVV